MEWAGGDGTPCGEAWWVVVGRLCCQLQAGPGSGRQEVTYGTSGSSPLHIILSLLSSQMAEVTLLTRFSDGYFRDKRGRAHRRSVWGLVLKKKLAYYSVFSCIDHGPGCMGTTRIWPTSYLAFMLPILSYSSTWRAGGSYQLVPKSAPASRYLYFTHDNLPDHTHCDRVKNVITCAFRPPFLSSR